MCIPVDVVIPQSARFQSCADMLFHSGYAVLFPCYRPHRRDTELPLREMRCLIVWSARRLVVERLHAGMVSPQSY